MEVITPHEYITLLKNERIICRKHLPWIYKIVLYTDNGVVYKALVQYHYQTLKKARRYGIDSEFDLRTNIPRKRLTTEEIYLKGTKMFSYDQITQEITVFEGEDLKPCLMR